MTFDPFAMQPAAEMLTVTSTSFAAGGTLARPQISAMAEPDGGDRSPHLAWSAVPGGTVSIAITGYDPDAPTGSGFWHLAAFGLPPTTTELPEGSVRIDGAHDGFPAGAKLLRHDGGSAGYVGAAPPAGHGDHRYAFTVHALDVDLADLDASASPAMLGFCMFQHVLARGTIVGTFGH